MLPVALTRAVRDREEAWFEAVECRPSRERRRAEIKDVAKTAADPLGDELGALALSGVELRS